MKRSKNEKLPNKEMMGTEDVYLMKNKLGVGSRIDMNRSRYKLDKGISENVEWKEKMERGDYHFEWVVSMNERNYTGVWC